VVLRADQLEIEPVASVDPLRHIAHVRANAIEVAGDVALSNLSVVTAKALISTLLSAEAVGVARWATDTASEYAKIREQFGRPIGSVPGRQAQVRRDDRRHRTRHGRRLGCGPRRR